VYSDLVDGIHLISIKKHQNSDPKSKKFYKNHTTTISSHTQVGAEAACSHPVNPCRCHGRQAARSDRISAPPNQRRDQIKRSISFVVMRYNDDIGRSVKKCKYVIPVHVEIQGSSSCKTASLLCAECSLIVPALTPPKARKERSHIKCVLIMI
jgi:hypothetical protein